MSSAHRNPGLTPGVLVFCVVESVVMHRALLIDEIMQTVLQHFIGQDDDYNNKHRGWILRMYRRTLAYLARTCKALSGPALDVLWERQSSLMPVLRLLPTFQLIGKGQYDFVSPIERAHWDRFLYYSSRIQTFTFTADGRILPSAYERVFRNDRRPLYLFPSLQRIIWSRNCPLDEVALLGFISPSLRIADIQSFGVQKFCSVNGDGDEKNILDLLLDSLSTISVQLECLKIGVLLTPNAEIAIPQFKSIQTLDIGTAGSWRSLIAFYALGRMQNLTELDILVTGLRFDDLDDLPPPLLFRSLKSLSVWGPPSTIGPMLRTLSSRQLRRLHVKAPYSFPLEEWTWCLTQLPPALMEVLKEFRLECMRGVHSLSETPGPIMSVVTPIMSCPNLEAVAFDLEGPLHASDDEVRQMVAAWPNLREFRLWFHKSGDGPTLQALASCASLCQNLCELELSIDARDGSHPSPYPLSTRPCRSMKRLALSGNATITVGHGEVVGKRIHELFPNLHQLDVHAWAAEENETWVAAKKNIPSLDIMQLKTGTPTRLK